MPPRPVRSKGCRTCRRRKVKCDEGRPHCKRCSNAWLACEGYSTEVGAAIFVNSTVQNVTVYNTVKDTQVVTTHSSPLCSDTAEEDFTILVSVPRNPDRPYKEALWVNFLAANLFPSSIHTPHLGSWIFEMINLDPTSLSYLTACCLGAAIFARTNGMIAEDLKAAAVYYEQALRSLNDNLRNPDRWLLPANVPAASLLGIYELMMFGSSEGYVKHAGGVGTLIRSRGAESHKSFPTRTYFIMSRLHIISEALVYRKRTFLNDPDWLSITTDLPKGPMRENFVIVNLLAQIPNMMADSDEAHAMANSTGHIPDGFMENFRSCVVNFLCDLFVWRWTWEARYPDYAYEVSVTSRSLSVDEQYQPLFDKAIYYKDFHIGRQPGLYAVAIILILEMAQTWGITNAATEALTLLADHERPWTAGPLTLPHNDVNPKEAADEIVRSVEYYLQGDHRMAGALHLLLPLRMAYRWVKDPRQRAWLKTVTDKMSMVHGFQFSTRLQNAQKFLADWQ